MVLCLAFEEKIHAKKSLIVGTFAGFCLVTETVIGYFTDRAHPMLPFGSITLPNGHEIALPIYVPAIDWSVITIILGASLFVEVTSRSGIFTWLAIKLTKQSKGDPCRLLPTAKQSHWARYHASSNRRITGTPAPHYGSRKGRLLWIGPTRGQHHRCGRSHAPIGSTAD